MSWRCQTCGKPGFGYCKESVINDLQKSFVHTNERPETNPPEFKEQPNPIPNESPAIIDLVIEEFKQRKDIGLARYGTVLQANNGRDALRDLLDELLDACVYIRQVMEERDVQK